MASATSEDATRAKLEAVMQTDVGVVRDHNEDAAHIDARRHFFIVADGMGGHTAGEVASAMAVDTVRRSLESARRSIDEFARKPSDQGRRELVQLLQNAVLAAHQAVYQRGVRESDKQGMGTTLDVVLVAGPEAFVAHVGDSRTYLIRDGRCAQITTDHTVAEVLVIEGKLSIEEAQVSPLRTILVNAIGVSADVGVEMAHLQLRPADRLLLCSDGLHDYFLAEQEIADKLSAGDPGSALGDMVTMAKERGGHDNITGVVINVVEIGPRGDGVPAEIEHDETAPVDSSTGNPVGWSDDEDTQTLSAKEIAEQAPSIKRAPTAPTMDDLPKAKAPASAPAPAAPAPEPTTQPMPAIPASDDVGTATTGPMAVPVPEGGAPAAPAAVVQAAGDDDDDRTMERPKARLPEADEAAKQPTSGAPPRDGSGGSAT